MKTFLKKTIALACFAMLMPLSLLAQDVLKVHGIVTDPSGEPPDRCQCKGWLF